MRSKIEDYNAVVEAASKFTKSVAEGNSKYAKELFTEDACLFGFLNGKLERGSIEQFYHNVDTVGAGDEFKTRIDVLELEETLAVVRVLEEGWGGTIDFTDVLLLLKIDGEWKCVAKALATKIIGQLAVGGLLGYMGGCALVWIVNRINLPNPSLYPILVLCSILIIFTFTDMFQGNGYLAVYVAGLVAGNSRLSYRRETNTFMQGITWLLQIVMFLTLGLLVNPKEMLNVWPVAVAIGLFMMFVSRPLAVFLCLLPYRDIPRKAKLFLSWVGLRGAVPIIFATYPVIAGIEDADFLFNVVFVITLLSLAIQGTTITAAAHKLDLATEEPKTGNDFGIELPDELESQLSELTLTEESLADGNRLQDMHFPKGTLVMMVKRGNSFIVPNGQLELRPGDILLTIAQQSMMGTPAKQ